VRELLGEIDALHQKRGVKASGNAK